MSTPEIPTRGWPNFDYTRDDITPQEWRENLDFYSRLYGGWRDHDTLRLVPFNRLLREHRPDVLKGWRRWAEVTGIGPDHPLPPKASALCTLVHYITICYDAGVDYMLRSLRPLLVTRAELLETLAVAALHGGPRALVVASPILEPFLDDWDEHAEDPSQWPPTWESDSDAVRSGLDFSSLEMTADERHLLEAWHLRNEGEVPSFVTFLADRFPPALKAYRERYEKAFRGALPKQMIPLFTLKIGIMLGQPSAIRRGIRHARHYGIEPDNVVHMIASAQEWLGHAGMDAVIDVAAPVLDE